MNIKIALCSLAALPSLALATVGGPQSIEVLGYDAPDQKVYILRHFHDGRGRLPQLSYYLLGSKQPQKQIDVSSLYIHHKTQKVDFDQDPATFNQALAKIQRRLQPLTKVNTNQLKLKVLQRKQRRVKAAMDPSCSLLEYQYRYQVQKSALRSPIQNAISYQPKIQLSQSYSIPKHNKILAVVKYQGIAMEGGYSVEDAVILK